MRNRRPTMVDVAREAGVGLKTVSRVVNGESGVSPEMADRVFLAVAKLGFRRNAMARDLRAGRSTASVGLVIEDLGNPFYSSVARGVEQLTHDRDFVLMTASSEEDPERERALVLELCQRRVEGMIIVPTALDHSFLQAEIEMGLQVVFLDRPATGLIADTVLVDNRGGAIAATDYLLDRGHQRIAVLGHEAKVWTMRERLAGFRSALARAGVPYPEDLVCLGPLTPADAATATAQLLDGGDPPTAFFACNNRMTVGVLAELQRRGGAADVSGFDDIETAGLFAQPLALVSYDAAEAGRRAAQLLLERLDGRRTPQQVVIPTTLVRYGSETAGRRAPAAGAGSRTRATRASTRAGSGSGAGG
ncbi:LacI family DNA-binding transcriptional regulator [Micromonospora sp. IBHARD004]|uniref:LacI family DNA-binding transcriptional regulator n=1 Tax=Micromonospora sp. IBHARD004 TaxID=3457764 RepID=UPI0040595FDD